MTTRREAAAVRLADLRLACVDTWSAANRAAADGNGPALYGEHFAAVRAAKDAEDAYRATLAEPAPALDPLTAATVAKLRAAADALERGEEPAGVGWVSRENYGPTVRGSADEARSSALWDVERHDGHPDIADVEWGVYVQIERAAPTSRECRGNGERSEEWDLVDPDAWTEPALDPCDDPDCSNCGCGGGLVQCN